MMRVLIILAIAAVLLFHKVSPRLGESPTVTGEAAETRPGVGSPRYFQAYPGAVTRSEDITAQIKRVAAARGISADLVRQLVNARGRTEQGINVQALNQDLDMRWPIK